MAEEAQPVPPQPTTFRPEDIPRITRLVSSETPAQRASFSRGGERERITTPPDRERQDVAKRLRSRMGVADDLQKDQRRLGTYDRLLIEDKGKHLVDKFGGSEALTDEEYALAWTVIVDELTEKSAATAKVIEREQTEGTPEKRPRLKKIPVLKRFYQEAQPGETTKKLEAGQEPQLHSDYTDKIGFAEWSDDRIITDIESLNKLRVSLEKRLGFPESSEGDWTVPDFTKKQGNRLHDAVVERLDMVLQREHSGKTFIELQHEDPIAAAQARHKAMQEGLMHFSDGMAKNLLKSERPEVDVRTIDAYIEDLTREPNPEEISKLEESKTKAAEAEQEAKTRHEELQRAREEVERELSLAELEYNRKKREHDRVNPMMDRDGEMRPRIDILIGQRQQQIDEILASIKTDEQQRSSPPAELKGQALAKFITDKDQLILRKRQQIADQQQHIEAQQDLLATLESAKDEAEEEVVHARMRYERLAGTDTHKGALAQAKEAWEKKQQERIEAEEKIRERRNEGTTAGAERKQKAEALRRWKQVGDPDNYAQIMEIGFRQGYGDRFTRDRLASITPEGDQLQGAELVREQIFGVIDKVNGYRTDEQKKLVREMLPDQAIADALIEVLRIDTTTIEGFTTATTDRDKLALLLPQLKHATQFQVGDVFRFAIHEGLHSAAQGEPHLTVPAQYREHPRPESEMRTDVATILKEDMGKVSFGQTESGQPTITWEGELGKLSAYADLLKGLNITSESKLNVRISETAFADNIETVIAFEVNEELLKCLPSEQSTIMYPKIREAFYDKGLLRTPLPQWADIRQIPNTGPDAQAEVMTYLMNQLSPEIEKKMSVATANEVIQMNPEERLQVVPGFTETETFTPTSDYNVSFDNEGNFWITEEQGQTAEARIDEIKAQFESIDDQENDPQARRLIREIVWIQDFGVEPGEKKELNAFFARAEENLRRSLEVQVLNTRQRTVLQAALNDIQSSVGREILRLQQRRAPRQPERTT